MIMNLPSILPLLLLGLGVLFFNQQVSASTRGPRGGSGLDNGRKLKDLDYCDTGCSGNNDCEQWLVCYRREPGNFIPTCCTAGNIVISNTAENYCVTAGCAAHTNDPNNPDPIADLVDDDFLNGNWPEIEECEDRDCDYNYQCKGDLECFQRDKGDNIPSCCSSKGYKTSSSTDYCVPTACNPTPAPTPIQLPEFCFSSDTHVMALPAEEGLPEPVPMKDLTVGRFVLTNNNGNQNENNNNSQYQPIYAFAHIQPEQSTEFVQIYTRNTLLSPLEVTPEHLVYVHDKGPVRADSIRPGDKVLQGGGEANSNNNNKSVVVTKVQHGQRDGVYTPLTESGTIVIDGIVVSNYISVQSSAVQYVELAGGRWTLSFLQQADVVHGWLSPLRLVCLGRGVPTTVKQALCHTHNDDGKLHYVQGGLRLAKYMEQQHVVTQVVVLIPILGALFVPLAVEYVVGAQHGLLVVLLLMMMMIVASLLLLAASKRNNSPSGKETI